MVRKSSSGESEKMMKKSVMNQERLRMFKRNQCLKKKTIELSTLCGIDAMIICLGNDGQITDTWPEEKPQIESVINRYRNYMISEKERGKEIKFKKKKKKGSSSILSENPSFDEISSLEGGVSENALKEYEMELKKLIQNPNSDDTLEGFAAEELTELEMELEKNNRGEGGGKEECMCINSSLVPRVSSSSSPSTELNEDPSMVLNFDTMMSSEFEENPSFASTSSSRFSEFLVEKKEGFLWDNQNLNSEFVMGGSNSSSWSSLSPSLPPAAVPSSSSSSSYGLEEFSVEGNIDDDNQAYGWLALPTVEEVLRLCNTAAVADDQLS